MGTIPARTGVVVYPPHDSRFFLHERRQMAVGQGGFHVGALCRPASEVVACPFDSVACFSKADFLYIYDCGSEPKKLVRREIDSLVDCRLPRGINILFLSHFDRDHICGTPSLLASPGGMRADTIVLPYVDDAERIVALGRAASHVADHFGKIDSFFVDMVVDPADALARFNPRQIIFVRSRNDDPYGPDDGAAPDYPTGGDPGRDEKRSGIYWKIIPAHPDQAVPPEVVRVGESGNAKVYTMRDAAMAVHDVAGVLHWKLLPYVRRADPATIAAFKAAVETELKWPLGSFDVKVSDPAIRRQMATSKRTKVAKAYKSAFKDKNLTSLCLYSGPLEPEDIDAYPLTPEYPDHHLSKIGWLGTGDAELADPADIAAFSHAYRADIDYVSTFLLPHHGSIKNTDPGNLVSEADFWVAAADPIHPWAHPHFSIQAAVAALPAEFRHVRGWPNTAFHECFVVLPK